MDTKSSALHRARRPAFVVASIFVVASVFMIGSRSPVFAYQQSDLSAAPSVATRSANAGLSPRGYRLGPGDEILISVADVEDGLNKGIRVDPNGFIDMPLVGRFKVSGKSIDETKELLAASYKQFIVNPRISLNILQYYSQPVSVLGAVNNPGVQQLQGPKRLLEAIAAAGGPRPDAGSRVRVIRPLSSGELDLKGAQRDTGGEFSVAELDFDRLLAGDSSDGNIYIRPDDVITVAKARLVYVMGEVKRAGGFPVRDGESMSIVKALSLAEGLQRTSSPAHARIIRTEGGKSRGIPVDASKILEGKAPDISLQAEDVLFVPNNLTKNVAARAAETALQIATGVVIWRH